MRKQVHLSARVQRSITGRSPFLWINEGWSPLARARSSSALNLGDVYDAHQAWDRFAPLLLKLFPELVPSGGIIESALYPADALQKAIIGGSDTRGRWMIKGDHALPVVGSIKARGGLYEILLHAENLALRNGLIKPQDDRAILASAASRESSRATK